MRVCIVVLWLLTIPTYAVCADGSANREADIASALSTLEHLKFDAQQARNISALDAMLDDGLMWVDSDGALFTKAAYLEKLHSADPGPLRIAPESMNFKIFDHLVVVVGIYDEKGIKAGRPYSQRCRFIDTWVFKNRKWILIGATATSTIS